MGQEPFEVDPGVLREVAGRFTDQAHRLTAGLHGVPGLVVTAPQWSAGAALADLETAVHRWCGRLGGRVAETADALGTAADGYETVDERAAGRLARLSP
ncbi:WXG100 family type VII secretion target [Micromonospora fluostatini]|uniref:WXG100 family type VII secretion target n=1 Tax=Micromonospora sp. JCM 30529 TaxID=3421643 RepID=UPI003D171E64